MKFNYLIKLIKFIQLYSKKKFNFFLFRSFLLSLCDLVVIYIISTSLTDDKSSILKDFSFLNIELNSNLNLILIILIAISLRIYFQKINSLYTSKFASWLSIQYYNSSIKTSHAKFLSISPEEYVSRLRFETLYSIDNTFLPLFDFFTAFFSIFNITLFAFLYSGFKYFFLICFLLLIFYFYILVTKGKMTNLSTIINKASLNSSRIITNIISSPRTYFLTQYSFLADEKYKSSEKNLWHAKTSARFLSQVPRSFFEFLLAGLCLIFLKNDKNIFLNDPKSVVMFLAFIRTFPFVVSSLSQASLVSSSFSVTYKIIKDLIEFFKNQRKSYRKYNYKSKEKDKLFELNKISFFYKKNKKINYIFKDFSYCFLRNRSYFIKGRSGSGKSTLFDLISELQEPEKGLINIYNNDKDNKFVPLKIEYISQSLVLPTIKIREFFQLGKSNILTDEEIYESLKKVKLDKIINGLNEKLETTIMHNAFQLSGGQKQRLLIANLFLTNPDLIIIDEGLTGVQQNLSKDILKKLSNYLSSTILITTHDESIIPRDIYVTVDLDKF